MLVVVYTKPAFRVDADRRKSRAGGMFNRPRRVKDGIGEQICAGEAGSGGLI